MGRLSIKDMDMEIEEIELKVTEMMDMESDHPEVADDARELNNEDGDQVMVDKEMVNYGGGG